MCFLRGQMTLRELAIIAVLLASFPYMGVPRDATTDTEVVERALCTRAFRVLVEGRSAEEACAINDLLASNLKCAGGPERLVMRLHGAHPVLVLVATRPDPTGRDVVVAPGGVHAAQRGPYSSLRLTAEDDCAVINTSEIHSSYARHIRAEIPR